MSSNFTTSPTISPFVDSPIVRQNTTKPSPVLSALVDSSSRQRPNALPSANPLGLPLNWQEPTPSIESDNWFSILPRSGPL
ncbi:unnamed protein product [Linum trigynum]|uniref:Uncharacterized protein n=1 Tax=Linum trigynum TaxID=586398 RepID=A0AAV2GGW0_9ROSI